MDQTEKKIGDCRILGWIQSYMENCKVTSVIFLCHVPCPLAIIITFFILFTGLMWIQNTGVNCRGTNVYFFRVRPDHLSYPGISFPIRWITSALVMWSVQDILKIFITPTFQMPTFLLMFPSVPLLLLHIVSQEIHLTSLFYLFIFSF